MTGLAQPAKCATPMHPVLDPATDCAERSIDAANVPLATGVTIAYRVYEVAANGGDAQPLCSAANGCDPERVVMIMGFAAGGNAWLPMVKKLLAPHHQRHTPMQICTFDNRGVGHSSIPQSKSVYTTSNMAQDTLALMDHLGWGRAHIVSHSMGSMIALMLAAAAPERVASLMLVSATGGGFQSVPLNWKAIRNVLRGGVRPDAMTRAHVDLAFHFPEKLLRQTDPVSGRQLRDHLIEEYVANNRAAGGLQPKHGQAGQLHAVMSHSVSDRDCSRLVTAGFPIKVIHGADDILAHPKYGARLAKRLAAPFVLLDGAHFIPRDCASQIVDELLASVDAARQGKRHAEVVHCSGGSADAAAAGAAWSCFGGCCGLRSKEMYLAS